MKRLDLPLLGIVIFLTFFGLLMIYDASSVLSNSIYGHKYQFFQDQILWMVLGFSALFIFSRVDYHRWFNLALPLLIMAFILLILVFVPGLGAGAKGANRWIDLHFF